MSDRRFSKSFYDLFFLFFCLFFLFVFQACNNNHDTSSLRKAVLGHWDAGKTHYYIGPEKILMAHEEGKRLEMSYVVLESNERENWITLELRTPYGGGHIKQLFFSENRKSCQEVGFLADVSLDPRQWKYLDARQSL